MLDFIAVTLHQMTFFGDIFVVLAQDFAVRTRRHHRRRPLRGNECHKRIGIVAFVRNDKLRSEIFNQGGTLSNVAVLPRCQQEVQAASPPREPGSEAACAAT